MLIIKSADKEDSEILTRLAIESEATWGFDAEFMEIFRRTYAVTPDFITGNLIYKMLECDQLVGFFGIVKEDLVSELEYFYIAPGYIGKGYGKKMWELMCKICQEKHIEMIEFVTSPEARAFYVSCGAQNIDTVESRVIKGRMIPKFRFSIE